jgi:choline dehydrogenase-like flavoprotein
MHRPAGALEDTYRTHVVGTPHRGVHEGRFRAWGGSTTRWGGQLWPWEPHEFERRTYLGLDGWPVGYDEVAPYYAAAFALLGVPGATLTPERAAAAGVRLPDLDPSDYALKYSSWLPWRLRNLGRSLGPALRRHPGVDVRLGTTALGVAMDGAGARGVRVRSPDGGERVIQADVVVVAGGTVETSRLLLASVDGGLGNRFGWLGRGFMDHLSVRVAPFRPRDPQAFAQMFAPVFVRGVQNTPRMLLRPRVLERERQLGAYGHWDVRLPPDSGLLVVRDKLRAVQSGRGIGLSREELRRVVAGARDVLALARGVVMDRRRDFPRDARVHLRVDTEQLPDAESRITLTDERDALGLPRVAVAWRVSELERRTVRRTAQLLGEELERRGVGTLEGAPDPFDESAAWGPLRGDSFHMMGGTRMATTAEQGVVDTELRVFGTDNVYVAGASAFPTSGMANPTLTLVALSLRLADHLHRSS